MTYLHRRCEMRIGFGGTCKLFTQMITSNKKALPVRSACGMKLNLFRIGFVKRRRLVRCRRCISCMISIFSMRSEERFDCGVEFAEPFKELLISHLSYLGGR